MTEEPDATPAPRPPEPPTTGNPRIDGALRQVVDLDDVPVDQHHDRIQRVQEVLQEVLEASRDGGRATAPGVPGPRVQ